MLNNDRFDYDIIIIGAGIAGVSLAYELADNARLLKNDNFKALRILVLEQEFAPGYHATGRSAAFWAQTYGGPYIEPLTSASGAFLKNPAAIFHDESFLNNRGALNIANEHQTDLMDVMLEKFASNNVKLSAVGYDFIKKQLDFINPHWNGAIWEPECSDIDVSALHQAYIRNAKKMGVAIISSAKMEKADFKDGVWHVKSAQGQYKSPIIVNAAGAWADDVARKSNMKPQNITPYRRTMIELQLNVKIPTNMPLIVALDGSFYFKAMPNGNIWLSPHDETACQAHDVAPEELDIAIAIDRFQNIVDCKVEKIIHKWAGLRSFSPDRLPVIGFGDNNYFWFVGQGGFGIQTAPATSKIAAHKIIDILWPDLPLSKSDIHHKKPDCIKNIDDNFYRPDRF